MLKVMIVDDEFYFREALKISLSWEQMGFCLCGEAKNGKEALDKVDDLDPDIIIVDINMPIMDGLEFVQNIKEKGINSKIIILSGHSEFHYAKQAVHLGVHNYLLKPVNEEELANALLEIKKIIEKEENIKIEFNRLKQQVKDSIPLLRDKFLNELIQGNLVQNEDELVKRMAYLNISFYQNSKGSPAPLQGVFLARRANKHDISSGFKSQTSGGVESPSEAPMFSSAQRVHSKHYRVITIEINHEGDQDWNDEDKQLWKFAVSNIASEFLAEYFPIEVCYDNNDRICIMISTNESRQDLNSLLESRLELIRSAVCKHLDFTVTIGVGNEKKALFDIASSYKESLVALKNELTEGKNRVIIYGSVEASEIKVNLFTAGHRNQILMNMRIGDNKEVLHLISQIFKEVREENIHHEILYVICIEMVSVCLEFIVEVGLSFKEVLPRNLLSIIEEIQSKRSINEIEGWIAGIFGDTLEAAKRNRSSKASELIEQVKKYIGDSYHNDEMNIDEIARNLYVNYAHLCFIFKRGTGITINEYLTQFRMDKAKKLFDTGNSLVLDVAGRVGYADANYFGKCFKKYYGLAPSKYIENKRHL